MLLNSLVCLSLSAKADARIKFRVLDIALNEGIIDREADITSA